MSSQHNLALLTWHAMGGKCSAQVPIEYAGLLVEIREAAAAYESLLSRFEAGSELSNLNASAGREVVISAALRDFLEAAVGAEALTGGLVNAAILNALREAGYTDDFETSPPLAVAIGASGPVARVASVLELGEHTARLAPGAAIDPGSIGKGWIADRIFAEVVPTAAPALISLCGDILCRAAPPGEAGWNVELADGSVVTMTDAAAATSGTTRKRWGKRHHHLIDPRTGRPADTDINAVSVVAATGTESEALSTAAAILGRSAAPAFLESAGALAWAAA